MTNPYFFDVLFLLILLGMFSYGKRKGAFKVIAGLFGTLTAWIGTLILRPRFLPIVTNLLKPWAYKAVLKAVEAAGLNEIINVTMEFSIDAQNATAALSTLPEKLAALGLPEQMALLAEKLNISTLLQDRLAFLPQGQIRPLEILTEALVDRIAPILTFLVLFFALKIAIQLAVTVLSLDWPIIRTVNRLAGGAIGLCGGLVLVVVLFFGILAYGSPEPTGITSGLLLRQSITGSLIAGLFV
ncbi:MAG: hypothetical protein IIY00_05010 [Clostridia bacterium]|nr:hypothetical protein [Clostridia bacterium]